MPYLSHNYRYQSKQKAKPLLNAALFVFFSATSIFIVFIVFGWMIEKNKTPQQPIIVQTNTGNLSADKTSSR